MYGHLSDADLTALRDKLQAAWERSLTGPTVAAGSGRRAEYQRSPSEIKRELMAVIAEIDRRAGTVYGGPIYLA